MFLLTSCAVEPSDDYSLTKDEVKAEGSATLPVQQRPSHLYANAAFIKTTPKGKQ